jgi:hypothetical protein
MVECGHGLAVENPPFGPSRPPHHMHVFEAELTWVQPFLCQRGGESGSRSSEGTPHSSSLLPRILTPYAVSRPRNCLQPFRFDFGSALGTLAESTLAYPLYRIGKSSDCLACEISLVRKSLSLIFRRSLISRISMPRRTCPHLLLGIGEDTLRFRNAGLQQLSKMLGLLGRQHVLTFGIFLSYRKLLSFSPRLAIMQPSFV